MIEGFRDYIFRVNVYYTNERTKILRVRSANLITNGLIFIFALVENVELRRCIGIHKISKQVEGTVLLSNIAIEIRVFKFTF